VILTVALGDAIGSSNRSGGRIERVDSAPRLVEHKRPGQASTTG